MRILQALLILLVLFLLGAGTYWFVTDFSPSLDSQMSRNATQEAMPTMTSTPHVLPGPLVQAMTEASKPTEIPTQIPTSTPSPAYTPTTIALQSGAMDPFINSALNTQSALKGFATPITYESALALNGSSKVLLITQGDGSGYSIKLWNWSSGETIPTGAKVYYTAITDNAHAQIIAHVLCAVVQANSVPTTGCSN